MHGAEAAWVLEINNLCCNGVNCVHRANVGIAENNTLDKLKLYCKPLLDIMLTGLLSWIEKQILFI